MRGRHTAGHNEAFTPGQRTILTAITRSAGKDRNAKVKVRGTINATIHELLGASDPGRAKRSSQRRTRRAEFVFLAWQRYLRSQQELKLRPRVIDFVCRVPRAARTKQQGVDLAVLAVITTPAGTSAIATAVRSDAAREKTINGNLHGTPFLSLIVPCYNGEKQLPAKLDELRTFLRAQPYSWELLLTDDASCEPAAALLRDFALANDGVTVIRNPTNLGKGASVTKAMLAARGRYRIFTDIDLAYPPSQITRMLEVLQSGADVAIACRALPESRYEMSPSFIHYLFTRHVLSRMLNRMVRLTLLRDVLDTQAGLKGFTAAAAATIFSRLTIPRFGFDIELLFVAQHHGLRIVQSPVNFRYEDEPSTVNFVQSAVTIGGDLLRIRRNSARGRYD